MIAFRTFKRYSSQFAPQLKSQVNEWSNQIKKQSWNFPDNYSIGQLVNLNQALRLIFPQVKRVDLSQAGIPIGYHFIYNNQPNTELGKDGYDNYQAPLNRDRESLFERRMWVNGYIQFHEENFKIPLLTRTTCKETIKSVRVIESSVFVSVNREFIDDKGTPIITELRSLVYTNDEYKLPDKERSLISIDREDTTVPFKLSYDDIKRYCALLYNVHKIHHDIEYCQKIEKLPDVIVPGPFMASIILTVFNSIYTQKIKSIKYKNVEPCLVNTNLHVVIKPIEQNSKYRLMIANLETNQIFIDSVVNVETT